GVASISYVDNMVFLLSVCCPPAPRIEEPFDGEEYTGNRCSQQFILDSFYPAVLALILRTPTESGRKAPVFWHGTPGGRRSGGAARRCGQRVGRTPLHQIDAQRPRSSVRGPSGLAQGYLVFARANLECVE